MPTPESYKALTEDELRERLALAESLCVLFGWGSSGSDATVQAWMEWANHVGSDYTSPRAHPDLNERRIHELDATRKRVRNETLRSIEENGG